MTRSLLPYHRPAIGRETCSDATITEIISPIHDAPAGLVHVICQLKRSPVPCEVPAVTIASHQRLTSVPCLPCLPCVNHPDAFTRLHSRRHRLPLELTSLTARATYKWPPPPRPTGLAPRRLGTHSPHLLRSLYLLQCFPHLSPPPSKLRLGRVLRRLDRTPRGPTRRVDCRAPLGDSRPYAREDVDWKASRTDSTRRTPGSTEATSETAFCLAASSV